MNRSLRRIGVACLVAASCFMPNILLAEQSSTQLYRLDTDESLWFVEISPQSFERMMQSVDVNEPFRATMELIQEGFSKLDRQGVINRSLGFHWDAKQETSMCKLYKIARNARDSRGTLETDSYYAIIGYRSESFDSCETNAQHLVQLVADSRAAAQLGSGKIWGLMVAPFSTKSVYEATFASVDAISVAVGLLPIAKDIDATAGGVPVGEWQKMLWGEYSSSDVKKYSVNWMGVEASDNVQTIAMDDWQKWLSIMQKENIPFVRATQWTNLKGFADTPPISIDDWQDWLEGQAEKTKDVLTGKGWTKFVARKRHIEDESLSTQNQRTVAATKISEEIYGTPAFGMLIGTICPLGYFDGSSPCVLPKLGASWNNEREKDKGEIFRVPIFGDSGADEDE